MIISLSINIYIYICYMCAYKANSLSVGIYNSNNKVCVYSSLFATRAAPAQIRRKIVGDFSRLRNMVVIGMRGEEHGPTWPNQSQVQPNLAWPELEPKSGHLLQLEPAWGTASAQRSPTWRNSGTFGRKTGPTRVTRAITRAPIEA